MRRSLLPSIFDELEAFCTPLNKCCTDTSCSKSNCEGLSISEDEHHLYLDAPLPGVKPEEVEVSVDPKKRSLLIRGTKSALRDDIKYHMRAPQEYCYEIPLSTEINLDGKVDAVSKDGILSITLAKNQGHKPLRVDVRTA